MLRRCRSLHFLWFFQWRVRRRQDLVAGGTGKSWLVWHCNIPSICPGFLSVFSSDKQRDCVDFCLYQRGLHWAGILYCALLLACFLFSCSFRRSELRINIHSAAEYCAWSLHTQVESLRGTRLLCEHSFLLWVTGWVERQINLALY